MNASHRIRPILKLSRINVAALIALAKAIYGGILAHPNLFPNPVPTLAALLQLIQALDVAHQATLTRAKGTVQTRNAKRAALLTGLETLRMYVQGLCDASPEQAEELIAAAAMTVAKVPTHAKPVLQAKQGPLPGSAALVANETLLVGRGVKKRVMFNWQMSADGGKTWTGAPSTPLASTIVEGLMPLTTYSFRVSVTVSKTTGEWSQAVTLLMR